MVVNIRNVVGCTMADITEAGGKNDVEGNEKGNELEYIDGERTEVDID